MTLSKEKTKFILSLHSKKEREKSRLFIAEGLKTVQDLLRFGMDCEMLVSAGEFSPVGDIPVFSCTEAEYKKISLLETPPGLMGIFRMRPFLPVSDIPAGEWILYADGISDPGNFGTIVRTCHWFGIRHIVTGNGTVSPYNPKSVQSTMGSLAAVHFYTGTVQEIQARQLPVYTADMKGTPVNRVTGALPGIIVMGSESHGISEEWKTGMTDITPVFIPPADENDRPESLNVSIATAVILQVLTGR